MLTKTHKYLTNVQSPQIASSKHKVKNNWHFDGKVISSVGESIEITPKSIILK